MKEDLFKSIDENWQKYRQESIKEEVTPAHKVLNNVFRAAEDTILKAVKTAEKAGFPSRKIWNQFDDHMDWIKMSMRKYKK